MEQKLFTKNFTLLVLGQASSLFGNYILRLALSMYVLEATGSAAVFGGMLSAAAIPAIFLSPFGGIAADRADRRKLMAASDALAGTAVLCAAVLLRESNALAVTAGLLIVLSVLGAFETPVVQACIPGMLEGDNIVRGNAVVNQVASVSYLIAPMLGGIFYAALGLKPVMGASVVCFFVTALLECFINTGYRPGEYRGNVIAMIKEDFLCGVRFVTKERTDIRKLLFLAASARFFVMGAALVGLPYLIRTVLGLNAKYYGAAESLMAVAVILGSVAAGLLAGKLKFEKLPSMLAAIGICMMPAGAAFLVSSGTPVRYAVLVASFCGMQIAISMFSIFAVSEIQQSTPGHLTGKVMAYVSAVTMCAQPAGQIVYGFLFDRFRGQVFLVLFCTGAAVCVLAAFARRMLDSAEG